MKGKASCVKPYKHHIHKQIGFIFKFLWDPCPIIALPCQPLSANNNFCLNWISQSCCMDLTKLLHGCIKVVLSISGPLPNKSKLKTKKSKLIEASASAKGVE